MQKQEVIRINRRQFLSAAAAVLATGVAVTLVGCDDDESTSPTGGDKNGTVEEANGHSHSVTISKAQIEAAAAVTLTLSGNGHTHALNLTAADVASIKAGSGAHNKQSEVTNSHSHIVHFI